tara:strand:+ start:222 stop:1058 length:837 start_codon:yes stop_codon:yes gene_type:complete
MAHLKSLFLKIIVSFLIFILISSIYYRFNPYDYREFLNKNYQLDITSYDQTLKNIKDNYNGFTTLYFLEQANKNYNNGIDYSWHDEINSISIFDNWILYLAKFVDPILIKLNLQKNNTYVFSNYESFKYQRALGRGFGTCSQNALGLSDLLYKKYNVKSKVVGLDGHVVVEAEIDNKKVVMDPSLNVFMPFSIKEAELNLDIVKEYYKYTDQPEIYNAYNASGNIFGDTYGSSNYSIHIKKTMLIKYFEIISDILSIILIGTLLAIIAIKVVYSKNGK